MKINEITTVGQLKSLLTEKIKKEYNHQDVDSIAIKTAKDLMQLKEAILQHTDDEETIKAINKVYAFCLKITPFIEYKKAIIKKERKNSENNKQKMEEDVIVDASADETVLKKAVSAATDAHTNVRVEKK